MGRFHMTHNNFIEMLRLSPDKSTYNFEQPVCHSRLNRAGEDILNSRRLLSQRDYTTTPISETTPLPLKSRNFSIRKTKPGITRLRTEGSNPEQSPALKHNVEKIRKLGLLGGIALKQVKYEGHIRIPTVYNDYHSASSNPGYSRKPDGGIYPK